MMGSLFFRIKTNSEKMSSFLVGTLYRVTKLCLQLLSQ